MASLILNRTAWICCLYPIVCSLEVLAVTCLVTKTPDNDCRVIAVDVDIMLITLKDRLREWFLVSNRITMIKESVTLNVSLSSHVDTVFITEVIPYRIIRIVTGTHGIDIKLLHALDVLNHTLTGNNISTIRIKFVTIHTLDIDRLSVYEKLRVLDLHLTEADFCRDIAGNPVSYNRFTPFFLFRRHDVSSHNLGNESI